MSEEIQEREKPQPIDLSQILAEDEAMEDFNPDADAFSGFPPPPDGVHVVKLRLNKNNSPSGLVAGKDRNGRGFVIADLEAEIVAEGEPQHGQRFFDSASTMVFQSTGTCKIAGILHELGVEVPRGVSKGELVQMFVSELEQEPLLRVESEWSARYEASPGKWKTAKRGMKKFPPKEGGGHSHIIEHQGERLTARANIVRYLPLEEAA